MRRAPPAEDTGRATAAERLAHALLEAARHSGKI